MTPQYLVTPTPYIQNHTTLVNTLKDRAQKHNIPKYHTIPYIANTVAWNKAILCGVFAPPDPTIGRALAWGLPTFHRYCTTLLQNQVATDT